MNNLCNSFRKVYFAMKKKSNGTFKKSAKKDYKIKTISKRKYFNEFHD